jgi:GNAT superfamily N-acetyltransferase
VNVYTEQAWRRRGVARFLMEALMQWARDERLDSLILHASTDGRPLYEQLGFEPTNEMRYVSPLSPPHPPPIPLDPQ